MLKVLVLAGCVALASTPPSQAQDSQAVVQVANGSLQGAVEDGVASWKGIPFAVPPVGPLRWRATQPVQDWTGIRDATEYASDCMQEPFPSDAAPLGTEPAEDCLYANVWRPAEAANGRLPVVVWIYGGGFVNGGASPPTYAGAAIAGRGVLFVSFNYRVGRFGFFAFPQLTAENADDGLLGNYGFMDQVAALGWLRENVAAFGGDPGNVTVIGESAGGMSVHNLVTSPLARGLFHKAVVMSGGDAKSADVTLAEAEEIGVNFARAQGLDPTASDALQRLRQLSAEEVTGGLNLSQLSETQGPRTFTRPFPDGTVAVDMDKAYASDAFAPVPMIVGATSADIGGPVGYMIAGAREAAGMLADKGVPVWHYRFSYVADAIGQTGAQHASEIPFFFDNTAIKYGSATTPQDIAIGRTIADYIVHFARTGEPNGPGLPLWPRYTRASDMIMDFAESGRAEVKPDPWGAEIDASRAR
ncbi:carboxylesterase/lipase family protein [Croceibacterium ferulae]|uniref:carboxylesterase/lipase family protein n=1 Tax=Croceibacterium ferulae TaxID=1854641 RepID=UPI000EB40AD5|nr:carboxylesterase family protein [Croceibacterium ferulae]